jgi:pyrroline-5-carboxylate reductase
MNTVKLGFLGAGNMAEAIARGLLSAKLMKPQDILVSDPDAARRERFAKEFRVSAVAENDEVVRRAPFIVIAVKPQKFKEALAPVAALFGPKKLVLSICAGLSTARIEATLAPGTRIVRAMPNTPMLVGRGMAAVCGGSKATSADVAKAMRLLGCSAQVIRVTEDQMDAVTAVSGSGPAYFFYLTELLTAAAVEVGLSPDDARILARVTCDGSARLLTESGEEAQDLRHKVTSPGGTTEAAIKKFDELGLAKIVTAAVTAARDRGRELGK